MKGGLVDIPTSEVIEAAYASLLHQLPVPNEFHVALYSQWARFDPRLAEIWVQYFATHWQQFNPIKLREEVLKQPWPGALAVLLEFTQKKVGEKIFSHWCSVVREKIPKGMHEQFFIGLRLIGSEAMQKDAILSATEYGKWGYLGRENLLGKSRKTGNLEVPAAARAEILRELLEKTPTIRIKDYWNALGQSISLRQAERDLEHSALVKSRGHTKGRYFIARRLR